ncbi:unnamed protein product [Somion occarium]
MRADLDTILHEDDDEDDSLFGSPPPSPGRGRSPSPLALPSGSGSKCAQNVGTLALPGSHLFSELPSAHMPALAVTAPSDVVQQRQQQLLAAPPVWAERRPSTQSSVNGSRSSSGVNTPTPAAPRVTKPPRKSKKTRADSTPRPTPPITLPDPSEPPPSNFLRNQQALLGLAGLVSGVKPANLALKRHTQGSTPNNPIVVEDEDDGPTIGRHPPASASGIPSVNLPTPPSDAILQTLINQKNIFPVVDALLRLASRGSEAQQLYPQQYSAFYRPPPGTTPDGTPTTPTTGPPPIKRRKLSSVPAGAADWDVPYPFAAGQGPADYRTNWERQRGKQLLGDLVGLVKSAARKAAAKNYYQSLTMQQQQMLWEQKYGTQQGPKVFRHYRPETMHYGLPPGQVPQVSQHYMGGYFQPPAAATPPPMASLVDPSKAAPSTSNGTPPQGYISSMAPYPPYYYPPYPYPLPGQPGASVSSPSTGSPPENVPASASASTHDDTNNENAYPRDLDDFLTLFSNMTPSELEQIFAMPAMDLASAMKTDDEAEMGAGTSSSDDVMDVDEREKLSASATTPSNVESPSGDAAMQSAIEQALYSMDPSLLSIDPALVALSFPSSSQSNAPEPSNHPRETSRPPQTPQISIQTSQASSRESTTSNTGAPPTPTLIGSPLSPRPLSEPDHGPQTPDWDGLFGDVEIVNGPGEVEGDGHGEGTGGEGEGKEGIRLGACSTRNGAKKSMLTKRVRFADSEGNDKGKGKEVMREVSPEQQGTLEDGPVRHVQGQEHASVQQIPEGQTQPVSQTPPYLHSPYASQSPPSTSSGPASSYPTNPITPLFTAPSLPYNQTPFVPPFNPYNPLNTLAQLNPLAGQSKTKTRNKEDILRRARAMRAQLVQEIERAKVEYWETTMEAGCLALLAKEKGLDGSVGGRVMEVASR